MPAITRCTVAEVDPIRRANSACLMPFNPSHASNLIPHSYARRNEPSTPDLRPVLWIPGPLPCTITDMAKGSKKRKIFGPWFLKEWREHNNLTVEKLADRVGMAGASISRLENRKQPYSQPVLEALAGALNCTPGDLVSRPPGFTDRLRAVMADMDADAQKKALAIVQALKDSEAA